jgi:hypothetical protein
MGYTHFFPQQRDFSVHEWSMITKAFMKLKDNLKYIELEKFFSNDFCETLSKNPDSNEYFIITPEFGTGWIDFFTHLKASRNGEKIICFNGIGEFSHETFIIEKSPKEKVFSFCKTNDKPYDLMVTSMLIVCEAYAKGALDISSDGDVDDWTNAMKFVSGVLKKPTKIFFNEKSILKVKSPTPEEIQDMEQENIFKEIFFNEKEKNDKKVSLKIINSESTTRG